MVKYYSITDKFTKNKVICFSEYEMEDNSESRIYAREIKLPDLLEELNTMLRRNGDSNRVHRYPIQKKG